MIQKMKTKAWDATPLPTHTHTHTHTHSQHMGYCHEILLLRTRYFANKLHVQYTITSFIQNYICFKYCKIRTKYFK